MAFELATGDYLFDPLATGSYTDDEDHLAHIVELLGEIPQHIKLRGSKYKSFFNEKGELWNIKKLHYWGLYDVLVEKYEWNPDDAKSFAAFLAPMLEYDTQKRATAAQCLSSPWLADV